MFDLAFLSYMKLLEDGEELGGAAEFEHDFPEALPADCVEGLCEVDKGSIKAHVLFPAFFLDLPQDENHVCGSPPGSEATLAFGENFFGDSRCNSIEKDPG